MASDAASFREDPPRPGQQRRLVDRVADLLADPAVPEDDKRLALTHLHALIGPQAETTTTTPTLATTQRNLAASKAEPQALAEGTGATIGGLLGTPLGPLGMSAGAGLGGMAGRRLAVGRPLGDEEAGGAYRRGGMGEVIGTQVIGPAGRYAAGLARTGLESLATRFPALSRAINQIAPRALRTAERGKEAVAALGTATDPLTAGVRGQQA